MKALDPLAVPLGDTTLVEASAGTGKTWTLATLYLRLLVEARLEVGQILVVTYTNAATAELRDRIRSRVREAVTVFEQAAAGTPPDAEPLASLVRRCRDAGTLDATVKHLRNALRGFDEAAIFTIHGFCQRILLENAFESGVAFDAELVTDERPLCNEVVQDFWVEHLHAAPPALVAYMQEHHQPKDMEVLARRVLSSRDMSILPKPKDAAPVDPTGLEELARELDPLVREAYRQWQGCADEVRALLASGQLNGNRYPAASIPGWCDELGASLAAAAAGRPLSCEHLVRFTAKRLKEATNRAGITPQHPFFDFCDRLHAADTALREECARQAHALQYALTRRVIKEVEQRHAAANTQSFDDLLYRLRDALEADGKRGGTLAAQIGDRFRAALIDEFQDTDPVQYAIFQQVYHGTGRPLFLIGDPKQAIYAFRGADVFTYVGAKNHARDNAWTLQVNHRSGAALVEGVNTLFSRVRAPFVFDDIPFAPAKPRSDAGSALGGAMAARPPLEILFFSRRDRAGAKRPTKDWANRNVPALTAAEIVALLEERPTIDGRPLHPGDIAVLCRKNRQAVAIQEALRAVGVPSVRQGEDSVFDSDEAEEIERALRAVAQPGEPRLLRAALATRLVGLDAEQLDDLQRKEQEWDVWAGRFSDWLDAWTRHGFMAAFRKLLASCGTQKRLLAIDNGDRRLTNVLHVAELLQTASREAHHGPLGLVDWLSLMRKDPTSRSDLGSEAAQIRLESDDEAVQLVTIHRSKGLEYGVVFCPFTWDGGDLSKDDQKWVRFHDEAAANELTLDLGSEEKSVHLERARLETFAENLRLLYVAVTRARHRCTLLWGDVSGDEWTPLGYLLHQADGPTSGAALMEATKKRLAALGCTERLAELNALAARAPESIAIREVVLPLATPPRTFRLADEEPTPLVAPGDGPLLDDHWRVSSFSGLAASGGRSHKAEEGLDHDAVAATDDLARAPAVIAPPLPLHELPKGARTGELLHAILEKIDFRRSDEAELGKRVAEELKRFGFEARHEAPIRHALDEVLATPIPAGDRTLRLADVSPERRLNEMQFVFGVRPGFDPRSLARCFEDHPSPGRTDDYPDRIRNLRFAALEGFLGGFIDLVFEHEDRWYVVDYKSNQLGTHAADYVPARLRPAMSQHHYHLQYHLYVLAVQRYLTLRCGEEFDFARNFGGVAYLFLRGMSPKHDPGCGVFFERPHPDLLHALSDLVGPAPGPEGGA